MALNLQIKMVEEEGTPFLYPEYGQWVTEKFIDEHPYILKNQTKQEALVLIQKNCLTSPRVELYVVDSDTGEVCGHLFLCPGEDMHYGDVVYVRTMYSSTPAVTRKLWKMGKEVVKAVKIPYLCHTKWHEDGTYTTHFVEVQ